MAICHKCRWYRRQFFRQCRWHRLQICHRCRWYRWSTLNCEYLREFSKKFETALMVYSGAWGKLNHEKNQNQKISWHCPSKGNLSGYQSVGITVDYCPRHFEWTIPLTFLLLWIGMTWTLMMMCSTATRSNWRQTSCGRDLAGWFPFPFPVSLVLCCVEDLLVLSSSLLIGTESPREQCCGSGTRCIFDPWIRDG